MSEVMEIMESISETMQDASIKKWLFISEFDSYAPGIPVLS